MIKKFLGDIFYFVVGSIRLSLYWVNIYLRLGELEEKKDALLARIIMLENKVGRLDDTEVTALMGTETANSEAKAKAEELTMGHKVDCECFACGRPPSWYKTALKEIGVKEMWGTANNPRITEYHAVTKIKDTSDHVPWCASFVCWCLEQAGLDSPKSAWAKSFLTYGKEVTLPRRGDICVFSRGSGGHVGFFHGEDQLDIFVLGGNQNNRVCLMNFPKSRLLSVRRP